jgi:hypothetical protein
MLSTPMPIQTEVGKLDHVAQALSDLDGVPLAEELAGPTTSSPGAGAGLDQLGRLVVARIQVVDSVSRILTCTDPAASTGRRRDLADRPEIAVRAAARG